MTTTTTTTIRARARVLFGSDREWVSFCCPICGAEVQHEIDDDDDGAREFGPYVCGDHTEDLIGVLPEPLSVDGGRVIYSAEIGTLDPAYALFASE